MVNETKTSVEVLEVKKMEVLFAEVVSQGNKVQLVVNLTVVRALRISTPKEVLHMQMR